MNKLLVFLITFISISFAYNISGILNKIDTKEKIAILSFDDGPLPFETKKILNILKEKKVKATFFLIGTNVLKYPELVEDIYFAGHDIGNHTFHHIRLDGLQGEELAFELDGFNKLQENILGFGPKYFRPPGGRINNLVIDAVNDRNLTILGWTINANDFLYKKEKISDDKLKDRANRILKFIDKKLTPGSIILMHNASVISIYVLPEIIELVRKKGYRFVKASDYIK